MAIQTVPNRQYITVENVDSSGVVIRIHADEAHRARYKTGTETEFESTKQEIRSVKVDMAKLADPTVSIKANNIIAGYEALKTLPEFSEAKDV